MNFSAKQTSGGLFGSSAKGCSDKMAAASTTTNQKGAIILCQSDVTVHDVLLGRGRGPNMHPGNQRYREIIYANRDNYNKASNRTEQTRITREIVNHIKTNGRFLKRLEVPKSQKKKKKRGEANADSWVVVSDATARLKVGQCLRYKLRQDAEQHDDGSLADEGYGEENHSGSTEKYSGGAVLPATDKSTGKIIEAEPILSGQPSRKYRKVEIPEEPALNAEELQALKSMNRSSFIPEDEDDSLDGFVESPLWEAKAVSQANAVEEHQEMEGNRSGSYYDSMFGHGDSYDSNFAYGNEIISDAEVLTALGYPQGPVGQPSKRTPVICYCGCRLKPSEAHKHGHQWVPGQGGIFAMRGGPLAMPTSQSSQSDAMLLSEPKKDAICTINDTNMMKNNTVNNTNFSSMVTPVANSSGMTPMVVSNSGWDAPMQSAPIQSAPIQSAPIQSAPIQSALPGNNMSTPFQVPDSAPMARPRLFRPFMPNVS